jgi:hypothetical protein
MFATIVFIVVVLAIVVLLFVFLTREKNKQQILKSKMSLEEWQTYLQSDAMVQGDFNPFLDVPINFIKNQSDFIVFNFHYLIQKNLEKIINLINLNLDQEKRDYLNRLLADELYLLIKDEYKPLVNIAFKVWGYDKENDTDLKIITYIMNLLESDDQLIFATELRSKIRETGGYLHVSLNPVSLVGVRV